MHQLAESVPLLIGPESRIGRNARPVGGQANPVLEATWLISALFEFLTRIGVVCFAKALTPHPPSASTQPLGGVDSLWIIRSMKENEWEVPNVTEAL